MTTLNTIAQITSTTNTVMAMRDEALAKDLLRVAQDNKVGAVGFYASMTTAGAVMNLAIVKKLESKGWKRTAKAVKVTTYFGMAMQIPTHVRVIKAIAKA